MFLRCLEGGQEAPLKARLHWALQLIQLPHGIPRNTHCFLFFPSFFPPLTLRKVAQQAERNTEALLAQALGAETCDWKEGGETRLTVPPAQRQIPSVLAQNYPAHRRICTAI